MMNLTNANHDYINFIFFPQKTKKKKKRNMNDENETGETDDLHVGKQFIRSITCTFCYKIGHNIK